MYVYFITLQCFIGANLNEPHTGKTFVLSTIYKNLRIKIRELTNASIFICVMHGKFDCIDYSISIFVHVIVHDTVNLVLIGKTSPINTLCTIPDPAEKKANMLDTSFSTSISTIKLLILL